MSFHTTLILDRRCCSIQPLAIKLDFGLIGRWKHGLLFRDAGVGRVVVFLGTGVDGGTNRGASSNEEVPEGFGTWFSTLDS